MRCERPRCVPMLHCVQFNKGSAAVTGLRKCNLYNELSLTDQSIRLSTLSDVVVDYSIRATFRSSLLRDVGHCISCQEIGTILTPELAQVAEITPSSFLAVVR